MSDPLEGISFGRYPLHRIVKLDENPLPFEFIDGYTYEHKGSHSPTLIFHGKGTVVISTEGSLYHKRVNVQFNKSVYNNKIPFERWIRSNLAEYTEKKDCLLVIDVASFHKTPCIKTALKENNVTAAHIPPGPTAYFQPLDVGFNGRFKMWMREEADLYCDRLEAVGLLPANMKNRSMIASLFKKTGIFLHHDGRGDHLVSIKGIELSKLRLEDWYRLPNLRINYAIDEVVEELDGLEEFLVPGQEASTNNYCLLKNKDLKHFCQARGLPVGGRKMQLIHRLEDDDASKLAR
ncbi:hypothetical protein GGS21DRAFT_489549 [Xylaria nigripes]|nr:hypothetical protein GGS21DRAFT_489549 [Xylaria nigripes]